jgi:hypothetical protein
MNKEKDYIATYCRSKQIGIEDWEIFNPSLKLTDKTTIGEIRAWYSKNENERMQLTIIELDNP